MLPFLSYWAAMNIGVHVSFWIRAFVFSGYMPSSWVVESYGNSTIWAMQRVGHDWTTKHAHGNSSFNFLRNLHTGCINLYPPHQCLLSFVLFMVSFAVQKFVSLIRPNLFIFVFISFALGDWPKKTLMQFMSENVFPVFPSRSFIMSCLIFKSLCCFYFCVWCEGVF